MSIIIKSIAIILLAMGIFKTFYLDGIYISLILIGIGIYLLDGRSEVKN